MKNINTYKHCIIAEPRNSDIQNDPFIKDFCENALIGIIFGKVFKDVTITERDDGNRLVNGTLLTIKHGLDPNEKVTIMTGFLRTKKRRVKLGHLRESKYYHDDIDLNALRRYFVESEQENVSIILPPLAICAFDSPSEAGDLVEKVYGELYGK